MSAFFGLQKGKMCDVEFTHLFCQKLFISIEYSSGVGQQPVLKSFVMIQRVGRALFAYPPSK